MIILGNALLFKVIVEFTFYRIFPHKHLLGTTNKQPTQTMHSHKQPRQKQKQKNSQNTNSKFTKTTKS